jgi:hypothetical protein
VLAAVARSAGAVRVLPPEELGHPPTPLRRTARTHDPRPVIVVAGYGFDPEIDGGYVHSSAQTSRRDGWFQAVCGTVTKADGGVRRFAFVPNIDTHPRRRIHDTLIAQGLQPNQLVTFLSDGAVDLAGWTDLMAPTAEYVLDWFHITMRFTVLANTMKGLTFDPDEDCDDIDPAVVLDDIQRDIASAKWHVGTATIIGPNSSCAT